MVVVAVAVVVVGLLIFVNHALNMAELLDLARNVNGSLVIETILFLGFLQQLHKEWVVDVYDRDYNPLLLLPLPHHNSQTALRNDLHHHLLLVVEMKVGEVQVKIIQHTNLVSTHISVLPNKNKQTKKPRKLQETPWCDGSFDLFCLKLIDRG